ncbi:YebC-like protein [Schizophyllum commune]
MFLSRAVAFSQRRCFSSTPLALSGHNKWSKIKEKKGANDAKKGAAHGKATRLIAVAVRSGGSPDPAKNIALANTIKRLREQDTPKDIIERALAKAASARDAKGEYLTYEALAHNVGLMIETLTENPKRTVGRVRELLNEHNARMASVAFMFNRVGLVRVAVPKEGITNDEVASKVTQIIETGLGADCLDFHSYPESEKEAVLDFTCEPTQLAALEAALAADGTCTVISAEQAYLPKDEAQVEDEDGEKVAKLVEDLQENEDVIRVTTTLDSLGSGSEDE